MVRTAAATISASPLRTLASTLRRKCTRHLCQLAPCSTAVTAAASPRWASLMTCTPVSPRSRSERKNSVQNSSVSLSPTAWPSTSRRPSADTPVATTTDPYSEAQFKTLKYAPVFPDRFGSLADARAFCEQVFTPDNYEHRHSGIRLHTPASVQHG